MDFLLNVAAGILQLASWITNHKELIGVVIGGSGIVSLSLNPIKKWLGLQKPFVITILHYLFALGAVGVHYVATSNSKSPTILFGQALIVLGTNQFVYPAVTKPLSNLLSDAKAQANVSNAEVEAKQLVSDYAG